MVATSNQKQTLVAVTNTEQFREDVENNPLPVLLDFYTPECGPCMALAPYLDEVAAAYAGRLSVIKIHSRDNWRVTVKLGVTSLPTMLLLKGGNEVSRLTGEIRPEDIREAIDRVLDESNV
ncbi:MAG: thioredoxin domain-containing protein [Anaerolineae bacterium]|jgi:thioredoxin 1